MELFDAPTTTDSCALRMQSTVPTQALVLMNDEFVEDQARHLAQRASLAAGDESSRIIERMFLLALARPPGPERLHQSLTFVKQREAQSDRSAALADLAHVLFNSSEFITIQ
jgi:hypothetical protein